MIYTISETLLVWKPDSEYTLTGTTYAGLKWESSDTKPTEKECTDGLATLQAAWDLENDSYKSKRRAEYPKFEDQFDQIYNEGIDAWKATIKTIKDKYPKP